MAGCSTYLSHALLNEVFRATDYTPSSAVYVALYTTDPGPNDSGTEVSGNGYQRVQVTFGPPSNRQISNSADVTFPEATGSWGTISYVGIKDAATGGNLLAYGAVTNPKAVDAGDQVIFRAGNITISLT